MLDCGEGDGRGRRGAGKSEESEKITAAASRSEKWKENKAKMRAMDPSGLDRSGGRTRDHHNIGRHGFIRFIEAVRIINQLVSTRNKMEERNLMGK